MNEQEKDLYILEYLYKTTLEKVCPDKSKEISAPFIYPLNWYEVPIPVKINLLIEAIQNEVLLPKFINIESIINQDKRTK